MHASCTPILILLTLRLRLWGYESCKISGLSAVEDSDSNTPYEPSAGIGFAIQKHLREEGQVITRIVGDNLLFAPPLCVNGDEIDQILSATKSAIDAVTL